MNLVTIHQEFIEGAIIIGAAAKNLKRTYTTPSVVHNKTLFLC